MSYSLLELSMGVGIEIAAAVGLPAHARAVRFQRRPADHHEVGALLLLPEADRRLAGGHEVPLGPVRDAPVGAAAVHPHVILVAGEEAVERIAGGGEIDGIRPGGSRPVGLALLLVLVGGGVPPG